MAKFLKSLFNPGEKKRKSHGDLKDDDNDFTPPLDGRRKLSISRSGRMKQNNKKRASLTQDLFGEDYHMHEKPASKEYHVHGKAFSETIQATSSSKPKEKENVTRVKKKPAAEIHKEDAGIMTPEEEIEIAFKVIENNT